MKKHTGTFFSFMFALIISAFTLTLAAGCAEKTADQRAAELQKAEAQKTKTSDGLHALTSEEMIRAVANAKEYFANTAWPVNNVPSSGIYNNCRPTDSNHNGKVSCSGKTPGTEGKSWTNVTVYCGYNGQILGCSDKDD